MNREYLDTSLREIWEWLNGPGLHVHPQDPLAYSRSYDRAIQLEQLAALLRIEDTLKEMTGDPERDYWRSNPPMPTT